MKTLVIVFLAIVGFAYADIWQNCGKASDHLKITAVTFTPNPPVSGQSLTVTLSGSIDEQVTSGKVQVSVTYSGNVPILDQTMDLCSVFPDITCPIPSGDFTKTISQTIPGFAPSGDYNGQIIATDQNGQEIACVTFAFTMGSSTVNVGPMALDDNIIGMVNQAGSTWVAGRNPRFEGVTLADASKLCKTNIIKNPDYIKQTTYKADSIPTSFDARKQWPNCIHPIRDQQQCGSCWAFSATEVLSDRFCIASQGKINVVLSPEDLVSCDQNDYGCQGGYLQNAWNYMVQDGVVVDSCFPYTAGGGDAPQCATKCTDGETWKKYYAKSGSVQNPTTIEAIQTAIMTSGPVQAAFSVYQDFFSYKSGVYSHKSGGLAGGHAIKIVGWGVDNGTPYWIVANSWGPSWGLNGFFWILRGSDECGIEDSVYFGEPKL